MTGSDLWVVFWVGLIGYSIYWSVTNNRARNIQRDKIFEIADEKGMTIHYLEQFDYMWIAMDIDSRRVLFLSSSESWFIVPFRDITGIQAFTRPHPGRTNLTDHGVMVRTNSFERPTIELATRNESKAETVFEKIRVAVIETPEPEPAPVVEKPQDPPKPSKKAVASPKNSSSNTPQGRTAQQMARDQAQEKEKTREKKFENAVRILKHFEWEVHDYIVLEEGVIFVKGTRLEIVFYPYTGHWKKIDMTKAPLWVCERVISNGVNAHQLRLFDESGACIDKMLVASQEQAEKADNLKQLVAKAKKTWEVILAPSSGSATVSKQPIVGETNANVGRHYETQRERRRREGRN